MFPDCENKYFTNNSQKYLKEINVLSREHQNITNCLYSII